MINMRSKSEAGTTLDRINRDVGVENYIFVDNSPRQTGYNREMLIMERLEIMDIRTTNPHSTW